MLRNPTKTELHTIHLVKSLLFKMTLWVWILTPIKKPCESTSIFHYPKGWILGNPWSSSNAQPYWSVRFKFNETPQKIKWGKNKVVVILEELPRSTFTHITGACSYPHECGPSCTHIHKHTWYIVDLCKHTPPKFHIYIILLDQKGKKLQL